MKRINREEQLAQRVKALKATQSEAIAKGNKPLGDAMRKTIAEAEADLAKWRNLLAKP
jgi:hypothetical protein